MFPDIINNLAPLEIEGFSVDDNNAVILHGYGYDIERIPGYRMNGVPNDQPGFAMEHPLIFEVGGDYATALKTWFDENPPDPLEKSGSILLEDLAGNTVNYINFICFAPDGYENGNDGRTRFTMKNPRLPDPYLHWSLGAPLFGSELSRNLLTDLHVQIDGVDTGMFYPVVVDDEVNRTLNLTYDVVEGHGILDWVERIVSGIGSKRHASVIPEDEEGNELPGRRNYYYTFPIKYEIIYGYGLNTKIKARVVLSYDWSELA